MNGLGARIQHHAGGFNLDPLLVAAVIVQESSGNPWAGRIEQFSKIWFTLFGRTRTQMAGWCPPAGRLPQLWDEACWRASSFGLMQVLGETARVLGFTGHYLGELYDPEVNLHYGCMYLARCLRRARAALSTSDKMEHYKLAFFFYNGSREYADLVFAHLGSGAAQRLLES